MSPLFLPARFSKEEAAHFFIRPRLKNLWGLLRKRPVKSALDGNPASLELVWMPAYAFQLSLSKGKLHSSTWVSVDASFGGFALFERGHILEERISESNCFPPVLNETEAEQRARQGLLRFVLRKRGAKPFIDDVEACLLYYQPVWVYYYHRMGRKIDLAVLDGYAGTPMGGQMRVAIVNAFIHLRKQKHP